MAKPSRWTALSLEFCHARVYSKPSADQIERVNECFKRLLKMPDGCSTLKQGRAPDGITVFPGLGNTSLAKARLAEGVEALTTLPT